MMDVMLQSNEYGKSGASTLFQKKAGALDRVGFHDGAFFVCQGTGFAYNFIGHKLFADVMQKGCNPDFMEIVRAKTESASASQADGQCRDVDNMGEGILISRLNGYQQGEGIDIAHEGPDEIFNDIIYAADIDLPATLDIKMELLDMRKGFIPDFCYSLMVI